MTIVQESPNGHRAFPPPLAVENPADLNRPDLPTDKADNNQPANVDPIIERERGFSSRERPAANVYPQDKLRGVNKDHQELSPIKEVAPTFAANSYQVPPKRFAPKAYPYRHDDTLNLPPETEPLPGRCQFMFSDGRQCTMARSHIHSSLCRFHAEREDQLFGSPVAGGSVVGAALDLPELYSACHDLTTAAGVNRALAQVFRLLAHRRISRQEAATFAKLGQLLIQSISAARAEFVAAPDVQIAQRVEQPINGVVERQKGVSSRESLAANVYPPAGESLPAVNVYQQDELRGVTQSHQELSPLHKVELRSVNKDHQELSRVNKTTPFLPHKDVELRGVKRSHQELSPVDKIVPSESAVADARGTSPLPSPVNDAEQDRDRSVNERPPSASSHAAKALKEVTPVGVDRGVSYVSHNQHLHGQHLNPSK